LAVRIYALAKELKIDSKELVDICTAIGIRGKGSALASLVEDEVEKLREYFRSSQSGQGGPAAPPPPRPVHAPPGPLAPQRPGDRLRDKKMPVILAPRPSGPVLGRGESPPPSPGAEEPTPAVGAAVPVEQPVAASAAAETPPPKPAERPAPPAEPEGPRSPGPLAGVMRRDEYVSPGQRGGKPPVLGGESRGAGVKPGRPAAGGRARPAIKLAPMPAVEQPSMAEARGSEPPAQKPDLKLPADALRASKSGNKPLAAHLRRHEDALEARRQATVQEEEGPPRDAAAAAKGRRRGKARVEEEAPMLGGREQRQLSRKRTTPADVSEVSPLKRLARRAKRSGASTSAPRKDRVTIDLPCTVRQLSEAAGIPAASILRILMREGVMTTIVAQMDPEMTELVAAELGVDVDFRTPVSTEDAVLAEIRDRVDDEEQLATRPPVITFLGHVDHGKTSLLDKILGLNVVSGESGGITQHIRAYQVDKDGKRISFVDTPGHEAFTEMRARGAHVTDIAVLVVAADDGVMPQTEEAISHARAAEVPIVVALNKCDLPDINVEQIFGQLANSNLLPSEWGGDTEVVRTSALTGKGIDDLLDTLLTVAELHEYRANPDRPALGTCLESQQDADRGVISKCIVQNGTLRVGDVVVCGQAYGRVKAMTDTLDPRRRVAEAGPSMPVNISGFDVAPGAGEHFYVLSDIAQAREIAEARAAKERSMSLGQGVEHVTLENLFDRLEGAGEVQTLNIILRADVRGSIEAIQKELGKLEHPEVRIKVLQATVGGVTEADVTLADASDAIIIGFNVVPDEKARNLADRRGIQVRRYEVIYKITEDLKAALEGLLKPDEREVDLGRALIQQVFRISRVGAVAGCRVLAGVVERNSRARVIRENTVIGDYPIETLRREKDDAKEVREGLECGIKLSGFNDVKEGDLLEVYRVEEVGRTFDDQGRSS
jgi:translation initiation factor IF-2